MRLYIYSLFFLFVLAVWLSPSAASAQSSHTYIVDQAFNPQDEGNGADDMIKTIGQPDYTARFTSSGSILLGRTVDRDLKFRNQPVRNLMRLSQNQVIDPAFAPSTNLDLTNMSMAFPQTFYPWRRDFAGANSDKFVSFTGNGGHMQMMRFNANGQLDTLLNHSYSAQIDRYYSGASYLPSGNPVALFYDVNGAAWTPGAEKLNEDGSIAEEVRPSEFFPNWSPSTSSIAYGESPTGQLQVLLSDFGTGQVSNTLLLKRYTVATGVNETLQLRTYPYTGPSDYTNLSNPTIFPFDPSHYYIKYGRYSVGSHMNLYPSGHVLERHMLDGTMDSTFTPFYWFSDFEVFYLPGRGLIAMPYPLNGDELMQAFRLNLSGTSSTVNFGFARDNKKLLDIGPNGEFLFTEHTVTAFNTIAPSGQIPTEGFGKLSLYSSQGVEIPMQATSGGFNAPAKISIQPGTHNWLAGGAFSLYNNFSNEGFARVAGNMPDASFRPDWQHVTDVRYLSGNRMYGYSAGGKSFFGFESGWNKYLPSGTKDNTYMGNIGSLLDNGYVAYLTQSPSAYNLTTYQGNTVVAGPLDVADNSDFGVNINPRRDSSMLKIVKLLSGGVLHEILSPQLQSRYTGAVIGDHPNLVTNYDGYGYANAISVSGSGVTYKGIERYLPTLKRDTTFHTAEYGEVYTVFPDLSFLIYQGDTLVRIMPDGQKDAYWPLIRTGNKRYAFHATDDMAYIYVTGEFYAFGGKPSTRIARLAQTSITESGDGAPKIRTLSLYPNPARRSVVARLDGGKGQTIALYSSTGKLIATKTMNYDGLAKLDIRSLPAGLYLVRSGGQVARLVVE